jgi:hypothetical protein
VERREFVESTMPDWPTAGELARMNDQALQQTLRWNAERLHESLGRFNTRASWQRYLRLPDDWTSNSSIERGQQHEALAETLRRFRFVAEKPEYSMIARLPAFNATQDALHEMVSRLENSAASRNVDEELPVPPQNRYYFND